MRNKMEQILSLIILAAITILSAPNASAESDLKTIDTAQLHSMIVDNAYRLEGGREINFTVIDARTKKEYDESHIFSAISIPENGFEQSMNLLPKDKGMLIVVYGNDTNTNMSKKWAGKARSAGYANISIYSEGFLVWKKNKMPIAPI